MEKDIYFSQARSSKLNVSAIFRTFPFCRVRKDNPTDIISRFLHYYASACRCGAVYRYRNSMTKYSLYTE